MSSGKIVLGVLAGVTVGAILGILFAPDKGSSTRKKILKKSSEYTEDLEDKFTELVDSITKKFEIVKKETIRKAENGKHIAEETVNEVVNAAK